MLISITFTPSLPPNGAVECDMHVKKRIFEEFNNQLSFPLITCSLRNNRKMFALRSMDYDDVVLCTSRPTHDRKQFSPDGATINSLDMITCNNK